MKVFDTDIASLIFEGDSNYETRFEAIPEDERSLAIVTVDELFRGRLSVIREAESPRSKRLLSEAYELLKRTTENTRDFTILPFTGVAESLSKSWHQAKISKGIKDLRIAAICVAHDATLVTRNRRDFERVPGLKLEIWA
jgi:tRNA(fMet)-specific endonuclease VapC